MNEKLNSHGPLDEHLLFLSGFRPTDPLTEAGDQTCESVEIAFPGSDLPTFKPDDLSDAGNSAVFARFAKGKLIWTDGSGFLCQ